jgi:hypothetical protein
MSGRGAISQPSLCVDYSDNYGSLRGLDISRIGQFPPRRGVVLVGDTIVGIDTLSSVLCVEPQIPISLPRPDFDFHDRSAHRTRLTPSGH